VHEISGDKVELPTDSIFENYTFFYIEFRSGNISLIVNKSIPFFCECFREYLYSYDINANINRYVEKNISERLIKSKAIKNLEVLYKDENAKANYRSLSDIQKLDCEIDIEHLIKILS
jgi:hypothetical protein